MDGRKFDLERLTEIATTEGMPTYEQSTNCESEVRTTMAARYSGLWGGLWINIPNSRLIFELFLEPDSPYAAYSQKKPEARPQGGICWL